MGKDKGRLPWAQRAQADPNARRAPAQPSVASSRLPKVFYGTHRTRSHTATGDVWVFEDEGGEGDSAGLAAFFDLESNNGDVYLRFPRGMALYATVDVSHTQDLSNANWAKVSIDWQEVSH